MTPLFGMAGLAEAGEAFALLIGYGGLLLLGILAAVTFFSRSQKAAILALFMALVYTLMFLPWRAFQSFQSNDPDVHHWVAAWRQFAWWWIIGMVVTLIAAVRAFCLSKPRSDQLEEKSGSAS